MSMIPELGHLYHDSAISNSSVILDAKEYLRTREINAREQRHLDQLNKYLDRAKTAGERVRNQQKWSVEQQLRALQIKTPSLEKGLRRETQRIRKMRQRFQSDFNEARTPGLFSHVISQPSGLYESRVQSSRSKYPVPSSARLTRASTFTRSGFLPSVGSLRKSTDSPSLFVSSFRISPEPRTVMRRRQEKDERFSLRKINRIQPKQPETTNFLRRAEHVIKSLHRLYRKLLEREENLRGKTWREILDPDSQDLLNRARMVLGQRVTDEMMDMFTREETFYQDQVLKEDQDETEHYHTEDQTEEQDKGEYSEHENTSVPTETVLRSSSSIVKFEKTPDKTKKDIVTNNRADSEKHLEVTVAEDTQRIRKASQDIPGFRRHRDGNTTDDRSIYLADIRQITEPSRRYLDSRRPNIGGEWSEVSTYKALWQQQPGTTAQDTRASRDPMVVTLTGKHRKTQLYH